MKLRFWRQCVHEHCKRIKTMGMKSGFRYFYFILVSIMATQAFAQDMSGWPDKTVCRLVKSGGVT